MHSVFAEEPFRTLPFLPWIVDAHCYCEARARDAALKIMSVEPCRRVPVLVRGEGIEGCTAGMLALSACLV